MVSKENSKIPGINQKVAIIILNWNSWQDTLECLESVYQITYPCYDVIIVDNGSKNDSLEKIKEYADGKVRVDSPFFTYSVKNKPIICIEYSREEAEIEQRMSSMEANNFQLSNRMIIIKNEKNYGFAEGNNIAIRFARRVLNPEYILLLNNDTVVEKTFLNRLVYTGNIDEESGFLGPTVYYYNYCGKKNIIHSIGGNINLRLGTSPPLATKEIDNGQYDSLRYVDYLEGACMLVKNDVISKIGLLDPVFFAYWEETDWCYRAHKKGYKIACVPSAKIWHKINETKINKIKIYLLTRNRFIFMRKNIDKKNLMIFFFYFSFFDFWYWLGLILFYFQDISLMAPFFKGIRDGFRYKK